ncbi:MAG: N-acetyl sugar amidotransferase [Nitrosarchaeum sp.]|nr:N-acetyl sugar amidotransferase [Nitrosarchaeum sp.]
MKYCKICLMPDTRPGLVFNDKGICKACINFEKQSKTNWKDRFEELKKICEKYRGINGDGYDCAIAVSGGKDSHFQTYIMKEKLKMNPVLLSVGNIDWTNTGRENLENISESFGCDIIQFQPNRKIAKKMFRKAFEQIGSPSWYLDALIYAFPAKMAMKLDTKLLVYGEDVNYTYGGKHDEETPSALNQFDNDVVKPVWKEWFDKEISEKDLEPTKFPTYEECKEFGLDPIYLSYFVPWNSVHNYQVAQRWGFKHLNHEYEREGSIDEYDQIDSLSYMLNPYLKFLKFGHSVATDNASRWIRYGIKTREEMIPIVEERDGKLDQGIVQKFCDFTGLSKKEFWDIMDKWYNRDLFEQDNDGVWHPKFKVGTGLVI